MDWLNSFSRVSSSSSNDNPSPPPPLHPNTPVLRPTNVVVDPMRQNINAAASTSSNIPLSKSISLIPSKSASHIQTPLPLPITGTSLTLSSTSESKHVGSISSTSNSSSTSSTSAAETFELELSWTNNRTIKVVLSHDETIKSMKEKTLEFMRDIFKAEGDIRLLFGGYDMIEDKTVGYYQLGSSSKVAVVRPPVDIR